MGRSMALNEWLLTLASRDAHRRLLDEAGSLAVAAWRLAHARCVTAATATHVPTMLELRGAAREIARRVGLGDDVPDGLSLARDCEALGLAVI